MREHTRDLLDSHTADCRAAMLERVEASIREHTPTSRPKAADIATEARDWIVKGHMPCECDYPETDPPGTVY